MVNSNKEPLETESISENGNISEDHALPEKIEKEDFKKLKNKKLSIGIIFVFIIFILFIKISFFQDKKPIYDKGEDVKIEEFEFTKTKLFSNIEIEKIDDNNTKIIHSVPYRHLDFCNFKDDYPWLDNFTDLDVDIKKLDKGYVDVVYEEFSYSPETYLDENNQFKLDPGFIDKISFRGSDVYKITLGAEGCGVYIYIIPDGEDTILIKRKKIAPFNGGFTDELVNEILNIEGIISPEEEEVIFNSILEDVFDVKSLK